MLPPRPTLAAAILLVGGLAWSIGHAPPVVASLADVARWEGQTVAVQGWATSVRDAPDGMRFDLVEGPHSLSVSLRATLDPPLVTGDHVELVGRLTRWQGRLRLDVEEAAAATILAQGPTEMASWEDLVARPAAWSGKPLVLRGTVEDGRLHDGPYSVAVGDGPWPRSGTVAVRGLLRDDPSCLCLRLDAREVSPWTP